MNNSEQTIEILGNWQTQDSRALMLWYKLYLEIPVVFWGGCFVCVLGFFIHSYRENISLSEEKANLLSTESGQLLMGWVGDSRWKAHFFLHGTDNQGLFSLLLLFKQSE